MSKNWLAVISATHAFRGREGGFIQVCHGKSAPLRRMRAGDRITIYAPSTHMGVKDALQSFVTLGTIADDHVFEFDMGGGFVPFRRAVTYREASPAPIAPLLPKLDLTRNNRNWGYQLRFGLLEISAQDMDSISEAMLKKTHSTMNQSPNGFTGSGKIKRAELPPPL